MRPFREIATAPADALPPGFEALRELGSGAGARVLHARRGGSEVCLRIASGSADPQAGAELAVLGRIDHPGLARLVDFGSFAGGASRYVARSWTVGTDLRSWAAGRDARELGALCVRMCPALVHLHARGYVHADLKLENVIVAADGHPVITDFGLSLHRDARREEISGSFYTIAPEVLLGGAATARSDLFSLGVMLHELLVGRKVTSQEFYARFPERPFLEAARSTAEELPEWARATVSALLSRDPARRPSSAAEVGRSLRARLGLAADHDPSFNEVRLPFTSFEGREEWWTRWIEATRAPARAGAEAWLLPAEEDAGRLFEDVRYRLALSRIDARVVRIRGDAELSVEGTHLDRSASEWLSSAAGGVLLLEVADESPWAERAAQFVAHAWVQARARAAERTPWMIVRSCRAPRELAEPWIAVEVPRIDADVIQRFLARELEGASAELAARLSELGEGASSAVERLLTDAVERGFIGQGEERPRLMQMPDGGWGSASALGRAGAESDQLDQLDQLGEFGELDELDGDTLRLLAGLDVLEGAAPMGALRELIGLEDERFARGCERALAARLVRAGERQGQRWLASALSAEAFGPSQDALLRELHATRADQLEGRAPPHRILPHRLRAATDGAPLRAVAEHSRELRESGRAELALVLARRCDRLERQRSGKAALELVAEVALDWAALGAPQRAEAALAELPADEAVTEEVRGWIELERRNPSGAAEHFARAIERSGETRSAPLITQALLLYEARRYEELERLLEEFERGRGSPPTQRQTWNLGMLRELSWFRRGEVERARVALLERLERARSKSDVEREATVRANLATLERRAGRLEDAARHLERAVELIDRLGKLPGLAQARALLGGTRRELGELLLAEPPLTSALALRERLGDAAGARAVRGMIGLLRADRGQLRAGIDELGESARVLRESGRANDAALLDARREELEARIGRKAPPRRSELSEKERTLEADPRILGAKARSAWLRGERGEAREYAERARSLAERLQLEVEADAARFLLYWLDRFAGAVANVPDFHAPRVRADHALLLLLAAEPEGIDAQAALELARSWLKASTSGLTADEAEAAQHTLLGFPDPWPEDLDSNAWNESAEWEMTVLSLLEINHRLVSQEDLDSLLGEIVKSAVSVAKAERGFLVLEEHGELSFDTARDSRHGDIAEPEIEVSRSALQQTLRDMRPLRLSNAIDDPLLGGARSVAELDLRSILCVPFEVEAGLRGAIYLDHRLREGAFDERAEHMLSLLSDQAALAIRQVRRVQEIRRLNRELEQRVVDREADLASARRELVRAGGLIPASGLIGSSPAIRRVHELIGRAAKVALPVLVAGPSGTGKELAARALHELSPRQKGPFIGENCAALPPSLIEAELFGARRGAFTGAERDREGMFERAHGGTLFLDEIGELPLELQAKLLRVLETSEVRRLGDDEVRKLDFRLVAATNRDLAVEVAAGRFRGDLMYRLDGLRIDMPPLSARAEDIPELVAHFLRQESARSHRERAIAPAVMARLSRRAWPGNVRELQNEVARLCALSEGDLVEAELVRDPSLSTHPAPAGGVQPLAELERAAILRAVEQCGGDKRQAAELLGISRAKIYQRLKEYRAEE